MAKGLEAPQLIAGAGVDSLPQERRKADRRRGSLWGFLVGGFRPRRRGGRRAEDRYALVDWHEPHLLLTAVLILLLSTADAFLTLNILLLGGEELNPFMAWMLDRNLLLFTAVKMLLTGGGVIILVATARARIFQAMTVSRVMHGFRRRLSHPSRVRVAYIGACPRPYKTRGLFVSLLGSFSYTTRRFSDGCIRSLKLRSNPPTT